MSFHLAAPDARSYCYLWGKVVTHVDLRYLVPNLGLLHNNLSRDQIDLRIERIGCRVSRLRDVMVGARCLA
jgi:hypothetical protein